MSEPVVSKLVSRSELRSYMNTGTADSAKYMLIGEGFTNLAESKNPIEYSRHYIHEKSERTDVTGYAPSVDYSVDTYTNNAVIKRIKDITDKELTGSDAQVEIVSVEMFADGEVNKAACTAYKRTYAVIPGGKGEGTEALIYTGTFKAVGDIVPGKFNVETSTFTSDATANAT